MDQRTIYAGNIEAALSNNRLLIGLACVILGIFGAIRDWHAHTQESAILRDGARAEGRVTRKWTRDESEAGKDYFVGYRFDLPGGPPIEAEHEISAVLYYSLRQGDPIAVLYSRADPRLSFPEGQGRAPRRTAILVSAMSALVALFGVGIVAWTWRDPSRGPTA